MPRGGGHSLKITGRRAPWKRGSGSGGACEKSWINRAKVLKENFLQEHRIGGKKSRKRIRGAIVEGEPPSASGLWVSSAGRELKIGPRPGIGVLMKLTEN